MAKLLCRKRTRTRNRRRQRGLRVFLGEPDLTLNPYGAMDFALDIDVTPKPDERVWLLTDLLGRTMGHVAEQPAGEFWIHPAGQALQTMQSMKRGPFKVLDDALAEIEIATRGTCRRAPETDPPEEELAS